MSDAIDAFVSAHQPAFEDDVNWGDLRLRHRLYLSDQPPPEDLVTSVRAVVFKRSNVVVVDEDFRGVPASHIMPGGRIEAGETIAQSLTREVLEECGWTLASARLFAFIHFHHLTPRPDGYTYPYPDFLHLLFVGEAGAYRRSAVKRAGEIETGSRLTPIRRAMPRMDPDQQAVLTAALAAR